MKKRLTAALLASLALCFSACGKGEGSADAVTLDAAALKDYVILRDDNAQGDAVKCGMDVRQAMEDAGMTLKLTTDFYREGVGEFEIRDHEILVGKTNREETKQFLDGLMPWQYGYALVNEKIVIAGHDVESSRAAVDAFIEKICGRETLYYSSADDFIYGEILEGSGKVYSALTADLREKSADEIVSLAGEAEVILLRGGKKDDLERLEEGLEGYSTGAKISAGGSYTYIFYRDSAYTYSSSGSLPLLKNPSLSSDKKGSLVYCVLRCKETRQKYVFCCASIPDGQGSDSMTVIADFLDQCASLPVVFSIDASDRDRETCEERLSKAGYSGARLLAKEKSGEDGEAFYVPHQWAAVSSLTAEDGVSRMEYQKVRR